MGSQPRDGQPNDADAPAGDDAHPQEKDAAELTDGAAESVRRGYDATQEAYSLDPGQVDSGDGGDEDERG
jgi:hypothetical protein